MNVVRSILGVLETLVSVYSLLCVVGIVSTWLPPAPGGGSRAVSLLRAATDPWFRLFSRLRLAVGTVDFTPVVALAALEVIRRTLAIAAMSGKIGVGVILSAALGVSWSAVAFFLAFFAVLILARGVAYALRWNSLHPAWRAIDGLINPVVYRTNRLIYRDRIVNYLQGLGTAFVLLAAVRFLAGLGVGQLVRILGALPF
jgi:YggT family protein